MGRPDRARRLTLALVTLVAGAGWVSAMEQDDEPAARTGVEALIEDARQGVTPAPDVMLAALLTEGPGSALTLVERLEDRGTQRLPGQVILRLETALDEVPAFTCARREQQDLAAWSTENRTALEVIAERGSAQDLTLAFHLAVPHREARSPDQRLVGQEFERAVHRTLARDRAGFRHIERLWPDTGPSVRRHLLSALGDSPDEAAAPLLTRLLGGTLSTDVQVLMALARAGRLRKAPLEERQYDRVRGYLSHAEAQLRECAIQALGRLDDQQSVGPLIDLLTDEAPRVRLAAHWALRELTAMTLEASTRPWSSWYEGERRWWREESGALIQRLRTIDPEQMAPVLREVATHQLFRRELGAELVPFLEHEDPEVVRMVIAALQGLRSDTAVQALEQVRDEHPNPAVQQQAIHALWVITGVPPERQLAGRRG